MILLALGVSCRYGAGSTVGDVPNVDDTLPAGATAESLAGERVLTDGAAGIEFTIVVVGAESALSSEGS